MPDTSCRTCGGDLVIHFKCEKCRKSIQKICTICNALTRKELHAKCIMWDQNSNKYDVMKVEKIRTNAKPVNSRTQLEQIILPNAPKRKCESIRLNLMLFGAVVFFILGFASLYLVSLSPTLADNIDMSKQPSSDVYSGYDVKTSSYTLTNCLAHGDGNTLGVMCPTSYGYVYKAILHMPEDFGSKFSDRGFNIRNVSVTEHPDGSVTMIYQNNSYKTNFASHI